LLTPTQSQQVLAAQRSQDACFGELALELGLMSRSDLAGLLFVQNAHSLRLGEALLSLGHMDKERFAALLKKFFRIKSRTSPLRKGPLQDPLLSEALAALFESLEKTCQRLAGVPTAQSPADANQDLALAAAGFEARGEHGRRIRCWIWVMGNAPWLGAEFFAMVERYFCASAARRGLGASCPMPDPDHEETARPGLALGLVTPQPGPCFVVACGEAV
jgi:hypothetical protein